MKAHNTSQKQMNFRDINVKETSTTTACLGS